MKSVGVARMNEVKSGIRFADGPIPAQLRSRGVARMNEVKSGSGLRA
jgi:hypothetical protein